MCARPPACLPARVRACVCVSRMPSSHVEWPLCISLDVTLHSLVSLHVVLISLQADLLTLFFPGPSPPLPSPHPPVLWQWKWQRQWHEREGPSPRQAGGAQCQLRQRRRRWRRQLERQWRQRQRQRHTGATRSLARRAVQLLCCTLHCLLW